MFFLFRLIRRSSPAARWALCGLLAAVGVALIVWGLVGHSTILAIRGVIELVIVGVITARLVRPGPAIPDRQDPRRLPY